MSEEGLGVFEVRADLWCIRNRAFTSNTYLCLLDHPGTCAVIDPGLDAEALEATLERLSVRPLAILCTHGHFDHLGGAARLQAKYGISLHLHAAEQKVVSTANFTMMVCKVPGRIEIPVVDRMMSDGSQVDVGTDSFRYFHAPGHTPGSSFIGWRDCVFTGDSLYRETVGLVKFPGENPAQLKASLLALWRVFPGGTLVCPGHGRSGLFGDIQRNNLALRAFLALGEPS